MSNDNSVCGESRSGAMPSRCTEISSIDRMDKRLEGVYAMLQGIQRDLAVSLAKQEHITDELKVVWTTINKKVDDTSASKVHSKLETQIEKIHGAIESDRRVIEQYQGDRKFVLGIVAAVTILLGAINGMAMKLISSYFEDIDVRLKTAERKSLDLFQQATLDSARNTGDIQDIKTALKDPHPPHTKGGSK